MGRFNYFFTGILIVYCIYPCTDDILLSVTSVCRMAPVSLRELTKQDCLDIIYPSGSMCQVSLHKMVPIRKSIEIIKNLIGMEPIISGFWFI